MVIDEIACLKDIKITQKPVVIWGTKTAAKIVYRVLQGIGLSVVAVGDNSKKSIGTTLFGIPVLSLHEIEVRYPNAIIIIGTFYHNVADTIIAQLKLCSNQFNFLRFEEMEYIYEMVCSKRSNLNKEKLFHIINNIHYAKNKIWKRETNEGVLLEYRYVVRDNANDLRDALLKIYGVKNLVLIMNSTKVKNTLELIDELREYDNIGHIIVVIDYKNTRIKSELEYLSKKVFYVICDESAPVKLIDELEKIGFAVCPKKIPDEIFNINNNKIGNVVTERYIVDSVAAYADRNRENIVNYESLSSEPVYIVQLFNGLANQTLMYLFGRFLEKESDRMVIFDDTILCLDIVDREENIDRICKWNKAMDRDKVEKGVLITREKNSFYEFNRAEVAEVFDIPIHLLSDYFDAETWNTYLKKVKQEHTYKYSQSYPLCHVLIENGVDMTIMRDNLMPDEILAVNSCCYIDAYAWGSPYAEKSVTDFMLEQINGYFIGVWATGKVDDWLFRNRQWVNKILNFNMDLNEENERYARNIKEIDGITVHIRRGDFAYFKLTPDMAYYRKAIELIEDTTSYKNKEYYIFSDDIEWCCEHKKELGIDKVEDRVVFVKGNSGARSSIDLYLMSLGKVIVPTPGSSFSYIAILMSRTVEKCICIPKYCYEVINGMNVEPILMVVK